MDDFVEGVAYNNKVTRIYFNKLNAVIEEDALLVSSFKIYKLFSDDGLSEIVIIDKLSNIDDLLFNLFKKTKCAKQTKRRSWL